MTRNLVNFASNERVDLLDFDAQQRNARSDSRSGLLHLLFASNVALARVHRQLSAWTIAASGPPDALVTVTPGAAIGVETLPDLTDDKGVVFGLDDVAAKTVDFTGRPNNTYTVYVRFVQDPGEPGARVFWDAGSAAETVSTLDTRLVVGWDVRAETSSPGNEWQAIGTVAWAGATVSGGDITHTRHLLFEGEESTSYAYEWGDGGNDRNADRATYGAHDLYTFVHMVRRQIAEILGGSQREWELPTTSLDALRTASSTLDKRGFTTVPAITATLATGTVTIATGGVAYTQGYLHSVPTFTDSSLPAGTSRWLAYDPTTGAYALYTSFTDAIASNRVPLLYFETDGGSLLTKAVEIAYRVTEWPDRLSLTVSGDAGHRAAFTDLESALRAANGVRSLAAADIPIDILVIGSTTVGATISTPYTAMSNVTIRGLNPTLSKITWSAMNALFDMGTSVTDWTVENLKVEFTGTAGAALTSAFMDISAATITRLRLRDLVCDLSGTGGGDLPVFVYNFNGSLVDSEIARCDVYTTDAFYYGDNNSSLSGVRIEDCRWTGEVLRIAATGHFVLAEQAQDTRIRDNTVTGVRGVPIRLLQPNKAWITGNRLENASDDEIVHLGDTLSYVVHRTWVQNNTMRQTAASASAVLLIEARDVGVDPAAIVISGNEIVGGDTTGTTGIILDGNLTTSLRGVTVYGNTIDTVETGIQLDGVDHSCVFGNSINAAVRGIDSLVGSTDNAYAGNALSTSGTGDGVLLSGGTNALTGNAIDASFTSDGVDVAGGGDSCAITGNAIDGAPAIRDASAECAITGNNINGDYLGTVTTSAETALTGNSIEGAVTVAGDEYAMTGNVVTGITTISSTSIRGCFTGNVFQGNVDHDGGENALTGNCFHDAFLIDTVATASGLAVTGNYFDDTANMVITDTTERVAFVGNHVTANMILEADDCVLAGNVYAGALTIDNVPDAANCVVVANRVIGTFSDLGATSLLFQVDATAAGFEPLNRV